MAISMLARQNILVFCERVVILVIDEALSEIEVAPISAALIGQKEVLGKRIGFVPSIGNILVWPPRLLLGTAQSLFRKMRKHCACRPFEHLQSDWIGGQFVRIDQATAGFVEGIAGQPIINVKLSSWLDGFGKGPHQPMNFCLRRLRTRNRVGARQSRQVLAKAVPRNESVKIVFVVEIVRIVVPAAKVRPWGGHSLTLTKWLQEAILIEMEKHLMILLKLSAETTVKKPYAGIRESGKRRRNRCGGVLGPNRYRARHPRTHRRNHCPLCELTSACRPHRSVPASV